jgi:ATP-dependent DNA helicase RecG
VNTGDGLGDSPQALILRIIKSKPTISITERGKQLAISTTPVEKTLKRLKAKGVLKRIGLPKSGYWEVLD